MIYKGNEAFYYDYTFAGLRDYVTESGFITSFIKSIESMKSVILDLGCGSGLHIKAILEQLDSTVFFVGIDGSRVLTKKAEANVTKKCGIVVSNLQENWPILSRKVDLVYATYNLYQSFLETDSIAHILVELKRVVKGGGLFIGDIHNEPGYLKKYKPKEKGIVKIPYGLCEIDYSYTRDTRFKDLRLLFKIMVEGREVSFRTNHRLRIMNHIQFTKELEENGFRLLHKFGSWSKDYFIPDESERMVGVFQRVE